MLEQNKAVIRDYVAAVNSGDMAALRAIFVKDAKVWGVLGTGGLDVVEPIWQELHHSLEMFLEIKDLVAEGNRVAVRFHETGRFVRPFRGLPGMTPTGRRYAISAMEWFEFDDEGRVVTRWGARDSAMIARQVTGSV